MKFKIKPYPHQLEILELSRKIKHLALFWEMGTGKTGGVINILRDKYYQRGHITKTLILTPQVTVFNWKREFEKFSAIKPDKIHVINMTGKQRLKLLRKAIMDKEEKPSKDCILITNWEALNNDALFEIFCAWKPDIIIGDELHLIKSYRAKRSKQAAYLADICRDHGGNIYGLTGTAILNSIADVYMQYRFLDGGETFGTNFSVFRNLYMQDENARWASRPGHYAKYVPRPAAFEDLHDKLYKRATRITKEQCLKDLPPLIKTRRYVELSTQQKRMYKEMKEDFITFVKSKEKERLSQAVVANLALTKALRLLQIVTGFVGTEDGEEVVFDKNPRLDAVGTLLEELASEHKIILWCSFRVNYKQLGDLCTKMGINHVFLTGKMSAKEKQESIDAFQNDKNVRCIIANRRAGGIGVNLTAASYSIVYSRNFSLGEEKQSEARNHRGGSQIHERIVKVDLVAKETIDELVLEALDSKQKISDKIIDWGKNEL